MGLLVHFLFLLFFFYPVYSLDFIDKTVDGFIKRVVTTDDAPEFKQFYLGVANKKNGYIHKLEKLSQMHKKTELQKIRELALNSLEIKHPEWAQQLKPYAFYERDENGTEAEQLKDIRLFLTRYAAYEEFLKERALAHSTMWNKFKAYSKQATQGCMNWVETWRTNKSS